MARFNKFWIALVGIGALVAMQQYHVQIPGLGDIVRDLIVGALVAGGVYQVPNSDG